LKLTRLIQLGLVTFTSLSLAGALSSCTSGDDPLAADPSGPGTTAGNGSVGQAGAQTGPLGGGGTSAVTQGGSGNAIATAGTASASGGVTSQGGVSSGGGVTSQGGTATSTPCTNAPPNNGDTCAHAVQYGWCSQTWLGDSCREACGKCSNGTAGTSSGGSNAGGGGHGGSSSGGSSSNGGFGGGGGQPPVIEGGTQGWASRYWDCCKPACGWKDNVPGGTSPVHSCNQQNQSLGGDYGKANACDGDQSGAYMCGNFGPWAVSDTLAYGFAAVKMGSDYCGKCYQIQFTGSSHTAANDPGSQSLQGKTMIVQAINTGGVDGTQFDLLIPGGGVGEKNACSTQWSGVDLGEQYGGFYLACQKAHNFDYASSKACAAQKCQSAFASKPDYLAGCNFFVNWLGAPDNPNLVFKETTCPAAITQLSGLKR
jgi:hypothetical protein